ncbi:hypothetical protein HPB50_007632 [Hyalomma asiaticum]|uniref:Uncharacterized protein n=1 Tax=Hyalomma asiaticum TaxID=266040 RepID=A0ACB7RYZ6_HYAAI|nr:hypothetical protein HPB50_007632 [Hyalomma asiaticum]
MTTITTKPLHRNMTPEKNNGRREARAQAINSKMQRLEGVLYVDASLVKSSSKAAAVVTHGERLINNAAVNTRESARAEELAIALALVKPGARVVVTNSKNAYGGYRKGVISSEAAATLTMEGAPERAVELVWLPAHTEVAGNVIADYPARAMTLREGQDADTTNPVLTYREITSEYGKDRRTFPEPHRALSREQQTFIRRIQTGSLTHPALMNKFYPETEEEVCPFCTNDIGTFAHILAECTSIKSPIPPAPLHPPPPLPHSTSDRRPHGPAPPCRSSSRWWPGGQELLVVYGS